LKDESDNFKVVKFWFTAYKVWFEIPPDSGVLRNTALPKHYQRVSDKITGADLGAPAPN
jgi:hypothetical protein